MIKNKSLWLSLLISHLSATQWKFSIKKLLGEPSSKHSKFGFKFSFAKSKYIDIFILAITSPEQHKVTILLYEHAQSCIWCCLWGVGQYLATQKRSWLDSFYCKHRIRISQTHFSGWNLENFGIRDLFQSACECSMAYWSINTPSAVLTNIWSISALRNAWYVKTRQRWSISSY